MPGLISLRNFAKKIVFILTKKTHKTGEDYVYLRIITYNFATRGPVSLFQRLYKAKFITLYGTQ